MNMYYIRYVMSPAVRLTHEITFSTADDVVREVWIRISPVPRDKKEVSSRPHAICMDFQMEAKSMQVALDRSSRLRSFVASVISFLTCTDLPTPRMKVAFDCSDEKTEHDFIQVIPLDIRRVSSRRLARKHFVELLKKYNRLTDQKAIERIPRAIRWFSHAAQEKNPLFRLLAYWFALESLDTLLVPDEELSIEKKRLREDSRQSIPKTLGVRLFMESVPGIEKGLYDKVRIIRHRIVHGFVKLGEVEEEAKALCPRLGRVAFVAISKVLSHDPPKSFPINPEPAASPQLLSVRTKVYHEEPGFFGLDKELPHFEEAPFKSLGSRIMRIKKVKKSDGLRFNPRMRPGVRLGPVALSVHDEEIEWANVELKLRKRT